MEVIHEPDRGRFVAYLPGGEAELSYVDLGNGILDFVHTFTPAAERGKGVAGKVVEAAVQYARAQNARVVPSCPVVRAWLTAHPEALPTSALAGDPSSA
ncbi:MAG: GNAT family N-acetyltransferase [Dehalococcoidia bacterium]